MTSPLFIRGLAAASLLVGLGVTATSAVASADGFHANAHALFVETDAPAGNSVLSYLRGPDGTVSYAGTFATGGLGQAAANAVADPLASQGGLALVGGGGLHVSERERESERH